MKKGKVNCNIGNVTNKLAEINENEKEGEKWDD